MRFLALLVGVMALAGAAVWRTGVLDGLDTPVLQAMVAGGFAAFGWIITYAYQEHRRNTERSEARKELYHALRAEIRDYLERFTYSELNDWKNEIQGEIRRGGDDPATRFDVFVPRHSGARIFAAFEDRLNFLGPNVTDPVVSFYKQMADIETFAEDLGGDAYRELPSVRRADAYGAYVRMLVEARTRGELAVEALTQELDKNASPGPDDRKRRQLARSAELRAWLNSQASDRRAP